MCVGQEFILIWTQFSALVILHKFFFFLLRSHYCHVHVCMLNKRVCLYVFLF